MPTKARSAPQTKTPDPQSLPIPSESTGPGLLLFEGEDPAHTRVRVYREGSDKRWVTHGYLATDEASEERIAELFGGGRWIGQLVTATPTGPSVIKGTKTFTVPGAYRPPLGLLPGLGPKPADAPAVTDGRGPPRPYTSDERMNPNDALSMVLVDRVLSTVERSKEIATTPTAVPWDKLFDMGLRVVELFTVKRADPNEAVMAELARLREQINRPPQGPVSSGVSDMATAMEALLDIRERISDGGRPKESDGLTGMIGDLVKLLAARQGQEGPAPVAPRTPLPDLRGKVEVPMAPRPVDARPMWQQLLAQYRGQLVTFARRDVDPGWVVETVMTLISDDLAGVLREFVLRPDAAAIAVQEIPELAEFPTFNTALWTGLKEAVVGGDGEHGERDAR